jgi:hypothetical protein
MSFVKLKPYSLVLLISITLSGCSQLNSEPTTSISPPQPSEIQFSQTDNSGDSMDEISYNSLILDTITYKETLVEDETTLLEIDLNQPILTSEHTVNAHELINDFYRQLLDKEKSYAIDYSLPLAKDDFSYSQEELTYPFLKHELYSYYDVKTNNGKHLSILNTLSEYTGGAHYNHFFSSSTFDVKTGKQVSLYDVLSLSKDLADDIILKQVEETIENQLNNGDAFYFENYKSNIRIAYNPEQFYLQDDRVFIYYQIYDLAPFALGLITFELLH